MAGPGMIGNARGWQGMRATRDVILLMGALASGLLPACHAVRPFGLGARFDCARAWRHSPDADRAPNGRRPSGLGDAFIPD